jgi:gluconolactonase
MVSTSPMALHYSPDESVLYVGDTGRPHGEFRVHQFMAFDVMENATAMANPRVFTVIEPWVPDGFRVDVDGNLYVTARKRSAGVELNRREDGQDSHA